MADGLTADVLLRLEHCTCSLLNLVKTVHLTALRSDADGYAHSHAELGFASGATRLLITDLVVSDALIATHSDGAVFYTAHAPSYAALVCALAEDLVQRRQGESPSEHVGRFVGKYRFLASTCLDQLTAVYRDLELKVSREFARARDNIRKAQGPSAPVDAPPALFMKGLSIAEGLLRPFAPFAGPIHRESTFFPSPRATTPKSMSSTPDELCDAWKDVQLALQVTRDLHLMIYGRDDPETHAAQIAVSVAGNPVNQLVVQGLLDNLDGHPPEVSLTTLIRRGSELLAEASEAATAHSQLLAPAIAESSSETIAVSFHGEGATSYSELAIRVASVLSECLDAAGPRKERGTLLSFRRGLSNFFVRFPCFQCGTTVADAIRMTAGLYDELSSQVKHERDRTLAAGWPSVAPLPAITNGHAGDPGPLAPVSTGAGNPPTEQSTQPAANGPSAAAETVDRGPTLILGAEDEAPVVLGNKKPLLSPQQWKTLHGLLKRGPLTKDQLENVCSDGRKILRAFRDGPDTDWARIVHMPGRGSRGGYRIITNWDELPGKPPH
jgi:hypothetical protein